MDVEQDCASYAEHHAADDYFDFGFHFICMSLIALPNKTPEPTAVGAGRSAIAVHVAGRRWLSFLR
jgi:hypothetical protein